MFSVVRVSLFACAVSLAAAAGNRPVVTNGDPSSGWNQGLLRSLVGGSSKLCDGGTWTCPQYFAEQGAKCALQRTECGGCTPPT